MMLKLFQALMLIIVAILLVAAMTCTFFDGYSKFAWTIIIVCTAYSYNLQFKEFLAKNKTQNKVEVKQDAVFMANLTPNDAGELVIDPATQVDPSTIELNEENDDAFLVAKTSDILHNLLLAGKLDEMYALLKTDGMKVIMLQRQFITNLHEVIDQQVIMMDDDMVKQAKVNKKLAKLKQEVKDKDILIKDLQGKTPAKPNKKTKK